MRAPNPALVRSGLGILATGGAPALRPEPAWTGSIIDGPRLMSPRPLRAEAIGKAEVSATAVIAYCYKKGLLGTAGTGLKQRKLRRPELVL